MEWHGLSYGEILLSLHSIFAVSSWIVEGDCRGEILFGATIQAKTVLCPLWYLEVRV